MKEIVFATNNVHKLSEVRRMVGDRFKVRSLSEIGCHDDIPETADTWTVPQGSRPPASQASIAPRTTM